MEQKVRQLLKTIHGSHLYSLAHEGSDTDWYIVNLDGKNHQSVVDGVDTNQVNLKTFVRLVNDGVPQALEALFSRQASYDEEYEPLMRVMFPNVEAARDRYPRAINVIATERAYTAQVVNMFLEFDFLEE